MSSGAYVFEDNALEVTAGNPLEIEEHVIAMLGQILVDVQCPGYRRASIADEHSFLDLPHQGSVSVARGRNLLASVIGGESSTLTGERQHPRHKTDHPLAKLALRDVARAPGTCRARSSS